MVVHRTVNATVAGSSPATQANYGHGIKAVPWTPNPEMSVRFRLSVPFHKHLHDVFFLYMLRPHSHGWGLAPLRPSLRVDGCSLTSHSPRRKRAREKSGSSAKVGYGTHQDQETCGDASSSAIRLR